MQQLRPKNIEIRRRSIQLKLVTVGRKWTPLFCKGLKEQNTEKSTFESIILSLSFCISTSNANASVRKNEDPIKNATITNITKIIHNKNY